MGLITAADEENVGSDGISTVLNTPRLGPSACSSKSDPSTSDLQGLADTAFDYFGINKECGLSGPEFLPPLLKTKRNVELGVDHTRGLNVRLHFISQHAAKAAMRLPDTSRCSPPSSSLLYLALRMPHGPGSSVPHHQSSPGSYNYCLYLAILLPHRHGQLRLYLFYSED